MRCSKCNHEITNCDEKFCTNCGNKLEKDYGKRKKNLLLGVIILGGILLICIILISKNSVIKKNEVTLSQFKEYMVNNSCEVKQSFVDGIAINEVVEDSKCQYSVGFINVENANKEDIYNKLTKIVDDNYGLMTRTKINLPNIEYFSYSTKGEYYRKVVLNQNTILIGVVKNEKAKLLDQVFNDFGYGEIGNLNIDIVGYILIGTVIILLFVCLYKFFKKLDISTYKAFIPFYNLFILLKTLTKKKWLYVILFIEYLLFIIIIFLNLLTFNSNIQFLYFLTFLIFVILYFILFINISINLSVALGKEKGFAILMIIFPIIGIPILAFSKEKMQINKKN